MNGLRFAVGLLMWVAAVEQSGAADSWVVAGERARCLVDKVPAYLKQGPVIVIYVEACPVTDPAEALSIYTANSALPDIAVSEEGATDRFVVYSPDELKCLARLPLDFMAEKVLLPKAPRC